MKWQIMVISVSGKYLGWTYPKRANGLIKKGRAVWLPGADHEVLVLKQEKEDKDNGTETQN